MKRPAIIAILALLLLGTTQLPADAHVKMTWYNHGVATHPTQAGGCTASASLTLKEFGKSGVTRLRVQWQLRGVNDLDGHFPTYAKSGWAYSQVFPNDALSYYMRFYLPQGHIIWPGQNSRYALWAKMIGERPSFWQRDLKIRASQGEVGGCDGGFYYPGI